MANLSKKMKNRLWNRIVFHTLILGGFWLQLGFVLTSKLEAKKEIFFLCFPKLCPRDAQERPKSAQERPKSAKSAPRAPQECLRGPQERPIEPQECPKSPQDAVQDKLFEQQRPGQIVGKTLSRTNRLKSLLKTNRLDIFLVSRFWFELKRFIERFIGMDGLSSADPSSPGGWTPPPQRSFAYQAFSHCFLNIYFTFIFILILIDFGVRFGMVLEWTFDMFSYVFHGSFRGQFGVVFCIDFEFELQALLFENNGFP